ncbi:hypothetical protein [Butyrivibrio sp. FCS014]|uniref:hypothetical protein n=1 Tax=Butyrivibrio sp. FCS014 TaxID=1408304 RepID=UPI00046337AF|nr:hypothetical protein [Butyrivibrio sp. FCS014]
MSDTTAIIIITLYMLAIVFGTHFIRTFAFNRYEAVTFECSSITTLISILLIWKYGARPWLIVLFAGMLLLFIIDAMSQWHFYMVLQDVIKKAFSARADYLERNGVDGSVNETLLTMASVAIMPSFSRFIEESKLFNNQGGFIGLIKSIMKRQRFQKKKYQMRESFAENVNLIGPCKPEIDDMMYDETHVVPGAIHANDLALDYPDEKKGLFAFDATGFGALIIVYAVLVYGLVTGASFGPAKEATFGGTALLLVASVLVTILSHVLRHFAFARYELVSYEFSFAALVITSFHIIHGLVTGENITALSYCIFAVTLVVFLGLSFANRRLDKALHEKINKQYEEIFYKIPLETETNRAKRRFLNNLKYICEWAVVPFPGSEKRFEMFSKLMFTQKMRDFENINKRKIDMPQKAAGLIDRIVPEYDSEVTVDDFCLPGERLAGFKRVTGAIGILEYAALFLCIALGML